MNENIQNTVSEWVKVELSVINSLCTKPQRWVGE
jgi:hypothetical protein